LDSVQHLSRSAAAYDVSNLQAVAGIVEQAPNRIRILCHLVHERVQLGAVFEVAGG